MPNACFVGDFANFQRYSILKNDRSKIYLLLPEVNTDRLLGFIAAFKRQSITQCEYFSIVLDNITH